jgi:hypothetical protein
MECSEVQEKLSAYVEDIIPPEEKQLVDEHLKACDRCSESLADLKKTLEYVGNLREVEPPPWLVQKIMARVRSDAEAKKGILQKLFFPLHVKLPIEAIAAIFVVLTTVYVFRMSQPQMEHTKAPLKEVGPRALSGEKGKVPVLAKRQPAPPEPREQFSVAKKTGDRARAPETPANGMEPEVVASPTGKVAYHKPDRKTLYSKMKPAVAARKQGGLSVVITVKEVKTATREIERALEQVGGHIIKRESFENRDLIVAELDSKKVEELLERLGPIGELHDKAAASEVQEGAVEIAVEIRSSRETRSTGGG